MGSYYNDVPTDPADMQWVSNRTNLQQGHAAAWWGASGTGSPVGIHQTAAQRAEQRLARRGFEIVRQQRGPRR